VRQGERSEALFVLLAGRLELRTEQEAERKVLGELAAGSIVGEVSLLTRQPAEATVKTLSRCWLLVMERHTFAEVLVTYPMVLEYVDQLAERRQQALDRLELV
jgi:CRP-like cAMP-binding protein